MAEQAQTVEQPQEDSIDVGDKIADIFAGREPKEQPREAAEAKDEEQTEEVEASDDSEPEAEVSEESDGYVEVEWEGQTYSVPPSIHEALMRNSDYTQKTQALSQQRQTVELQQKEIVLAQEQARFQQSVAQEIDQVKMLDAYIGHVQHNTNWAELSTDEAFRAKMELDNLKEQKAQLEQTLQGKYQEFQTGITQKRAELKAEIDGTLSKAITGWSDSVKADVQKYVRDSGYPDIGVENMSVLDYQIAYKAMQFDQLKSKSSKAVKQASAAPAIKPKSRNEMPKKVQQKLNYRNQLKRTDDPRVREKLASERIADIFGG